MWTQPERGIFLPLLALISTVIIVLAALAIDSGLVNSSKAQHQHSADSAVLAAMEAYISSKDTYGEFDGQEPDYQQRLVDATERAKDILGRNVSLMFSRHFLEHTLTEYPQNNIQALQSDVSRNSGAENGKIIPGVWHFSEPQGGCAAYSAPSYVYSESVLPSCPCPSNKWAGACFQEIAIDKSNRANALRLELQLRDDSKLRTIFGAIANRDTFNYSVTATAALVPRHGLFLADVSSSVISDTHLRPDRLWPDRLNLSGEYNYLASDNTCSALAGAPYADALLYGELDAVRPATLPIYAKRHYRFRSDGVTLEHACRSAKGSTTLAGQNIPSRTFLFEQVVPPQPLTDILDGIHSAMLLFSQRRVAGDLFGLAGFDDDILNVRTLNIGEPVPDLQWTSTSCTQGGEFCEFYKATDASNIDNKIDKLLFPRKDGLHGTSDRPRVFTDLPYALQAGKTMLANAKATFGAESAVESFIVIFTDGITMCRYDETSTATRYCRTESSVFRDSTYEVFDIAQQLAQSKTAVHFVLFGERVRPHTLLRKYDNKRCMREEEARELNYSMVKPRFAGVDDNPFWAPNIFYDYAAVPTGGSWIPVRPCCRNAKGQCANVTTLLDQKCGASSVSNFDVIAKDPFDYFVDANGDGINDDGKYDDFYKDQFRTGRLLCDPEGRSERTQIMSAIGKIIEENPIILVEAR
ncbi:MAG: Tad domain-containing protein [Deltaproteobacteria bacterium]|nr:Tad domain-containing protein [Deltaproteobacteria bacterium]